MTVWTRWLKTTAYEKLDGRIETIKIKMNSGHIVKLRCTAADTFIIDSKGHLCVTAENNKITVVTK